MIIVHVAAVVIEFMRSL